MLKVDKISVSYGDVQALWDVSFAASEGEITVIIGSNGAGKSTILKTIIGLLHPTTGTIDFLGTKIDKLPPHRIVESGIALVPEGRELFPNLTVLENLEMGSYTREAKNKRKESLEEVYQMFPTLKERKKQLAGTLSGGEQQMLAIGRGLMASPKLLMLDEPSLGLAPMLVSQIFKIIEEIKKMGLSVLLVEQNVYHAMNLSDVGYVLETGRIGLVGKRDELIHNDHVRRAYLGL